MSQESAVEHDMSDDKKNNPSGYDVTGVELEEVDEVTKKATLSIPQDEISKQFNAKIASLQGSVKLKGFRPGKAPLHMIEKQYGDRVHFEVAERLISDAINTIAQTNELHVVGQPSIDLDSMERGKDIEFSVEYSLYPKPDVTGYDKVKVEVEKHLVSDEDLNNAIDEYRASRATQVEITDRKDAQEGDIIDAAVQVTVEGEEPRPEEPLVVGLGEGQLPEELEQGIPGLSIGESKEIEMSIDEDHPNEGLRGKKLTYKVTLNGLKKKELPELTDDFVKGLNLNGVETVLELRKDARERLENMAKENQSAATREAILLDLLEKNEFLVPGALIDNEVRAMIVRSGIIDPNKVDVNQLPLERFKEQFGEVAEKRVKMSIIVDRVGEKEDLVAKQEDLDAHIAEVVEKYNLPEEDVKKFLFAQDRMLETAMEVTRNKVLAFLEDKADLTLVDKKDDADEKKDSKKKKKDTKKK